MKIFLLNSAGNTLAGASPAPSCAESGAFLLSGSPPCIHKAFDHPVEKEAVVKASLPAL
jgi:hypothetical protein